MSKPEKDPWTNASVARNPNRKELRKEGKWSSGKIPKDAKPAKQGWPKRLSPKIPKGK